MNEAMQLPDGKRIPVVVETDATQTGKPCFSLLVPLAAACRAKAIPSSRRTWPGFPRSFSSTSTSWGALPSRFQSRWRGAASTPSQSGRHLGGRRLTSVVHGICKTRVVLTRFSVPLIPNTRHAAQVNPRRIAVPGERRRPGGIVTFPG